MFISYTNWPVWRKTLTRRLTRAWRSTATAGKRSTEFRNDDDRESLAIHDTSSLCQLRTTPPPVYCQGQVRVTEQNIFLCVLCTLFSPWENVIFVGLYLYRESILRYPNNFQNQFFTPPYMLTLLYLNPLWNIILIKILKV